MAELAAELRDQRAAPPPDLAQIGDIIAGESTADDFDALKEISRCGVSYLRVAAMLGIRRLRDPKSVQFLIEQLSSSDPAVEYEAIITLAEMTSKGGQYGPARSVFDQDPMRYRMLWLDWWQAEGYDLFRE
jgi:HEAT repeat protein